MIQTEITLTGAQYTFLPLAKQIVFAPSVGPLDLSQILIITNLANNVMFYQFNYPGTGFGGDLSGQTLTLDYDTTTMLASDPLLIRITVRNGNGTKDTTLDEVLLELKRISFILQGALNIPVPDDRSLLS